MNILFMTSPPPKEDECYFYANEKRAPLGLGYLISVVRNEGHKVHFIDHHLCEQEIDYEEYLNKNKINFVGISIYTACFQGALRHIQKIQKIREDGKWDGKIIIGGPHTSIAVETIPEYIDHIIIGEGEGVILDVISGISNRIVKGIKIKDMDSLPYPAWDVFSKLPYDFGCMWTEEKPVFTMNTSRGCPYECSFCSLKSIWGKNYVSYSPSRMVDEVEYLMNEFGARVIYFREDNFTADRRRVEKFCQILNERKLFIKWTCETRVDTLDKSLIELMSRNGCIGLFFGVESGSQRILDMMKKRITIQQIKDVFKWCKEAFIKTYASFISGFPGETIEDLILTQKFIKEIKPDIWHINVFLGIPGSNEYNMMLEDKKYAYKDPNGILYQADFNIRSNYLYGKHLPRIPYYGKGQFGSELEVMKQKITNKVIEIIESVKRDNLNFCIYGAGTQTKRLLEKFNFSDVKISAFFDADIKKQGKTLNNAPIYSPDKISEIRPDMILIATTLSITEIYSLLKDITKDLGTNVVRLYEENDLYLLNEDYI